MYVCRRVLRLFGRLKELRKIINGIISSILPLIQAILLALLIACIFCTFAVEFFNEKAPVHFGNFGRAFYTLFKVILGHWPDDILKPFDEEGNPQVATLVFFYTYILIEVIVLLQVNRNNAFV